MPRPSSLLYLLALSTINPAADAFWRAACSVVQTGRIDPILSPDTISGHVHKLAGGNEVNPYSTYESLQTSNCSSCEIQADKSAYWTPQLYYAHSNGSFESVPNYGMTVYYVGAGQNTTTTVPFPEGFKMLSGNSLKRSYDNNTLTYLDTRPIADRVSFRCINEDNDLPETHYLNDTNCVNGLRAQLNFQSCWDGVNLYLNESAHVAYLSDIDSGVCPPDHPVQLPHLFFEVLYWTIDIDQSEGGQFVFANGDTTGYGFHGDFLNGWDMDVQTAAVADCLYPTSDDGVVANCPALVPSDDINFPRDCLPEAEYWDEPVLGMLSQLPGCNPISSGPEDATQVICPVDSDQPISTSTAPASSSPTTTFTGSFVATSTFTGTELTVALSAFPTSTPDPAALTTATTVSLGADAQPSGGIFVAIYSANSSIALTSILYPTNSSALFTNVTAGPIATTFVTLTAPVTIEITSVIDTTIAGAAVTSFPTTPAGVRRAARRAFTA